MQALIAAQCACYQMHAMMPSMQRDMNVERGQRDIWIVDTGRLQIPLGPTVQLRPLRDFYLHVVVALAQHYSCSCLTARKALLGRHAMCVSVRMRRIGQRQVLSIPLQMMLQPTFML